jgi:hypothetical protein
MSETPPYYRPTAPRKNSNTILIVVLICVVVVPCLGLIALGLFTYRFATDTIVPMAGCMVTFESAKKAMTTYTAEKGVFPKADSWQTEIAPYYAKIVDAKKEEYGPFAPSKANEPWVCKGDPNSGIAFNSDLSGKKVADIKDRIKTVMLFETEKSGLNAHESYKVKPKETSPKLMGNHRGWIYVTVNGDIEGFEDNKNSSFNFD